MWWRFAVPAVGTIWCCPTSWAPATRPPGGGVVPLLNDPKASIPSDAPHPRTTARRSAMTVGQYPRSAAPGYPPTVRQPGPPPVGPPPPHAGRPPRAPKRRHRVRNWTLGVLGVLVLLPLLAFVVGWLIF